MRSCAGLAPAVAASGHPGATLRAWRRRDGKARIMRRFRGDGYRRRRNAL